MSKRNRRRRQPSAPGKPFEQPFEGPPKAGPGQVLEIERFNEGSAGTKRRFHNHGEHPLTLALHRGQINDALYAAGNTYRVLFEKLGRSGKDSTQALDASRGSGQAMPFTETQVEAVHAMKRIEGKMSPRNYRIVRKFCGEGRTMAESVMAATGCHPNGVKYRLIEALEELEDALDAARLRKTA